MQIIWKAGALVLAVSLLGLAMCNAHRESMRATKAPSMVSQSPRDMSYSTTVLPASKLGPVIPAPSNNVVLPASKAGPVLLPESKAGPVFLRPQQQAAAVRR